MVCSQNIKTLTMCLNCVTGKVLTTIKPIHHSLFGQVYLIHIKPAAFRARTNSRPNSRSLPLQVIGNVQGNAIGKIWTPLSFQILSTHTTKPLATTQLTTGNDVSIHIFKISCVLFSKYVTIIKTISHVFCYRVHVIHLIFEDYYIQFHILLLS